MNLLLSHGYVLHRDPLERKIMKPYPPLGLLYLSAYVKQAGFSVSVFDSTFAEPAAFVARLAEERPSVVGLYSTLMTKFRPDGGVLGFQQGLEADAAFDRRPLYSGHR